MTTIVDDEKSIKKIGIVIPAFNEEKTIKKVILSAIKYGIPIVVDDGSSDDTCEVARKNGATVVKHKTNQGYDNALNSGFSKARDLDCSYIITLDADGQHDPNILESYINAIDSGADIVLGIRDRTQRISEKIFAIIAKAKFGIEDPLCGMKAYRIEVYNELGHFDSYNSIGTELAIFAARTKKNIVQIHFTTRDRVDRPRFGKIVSANFRILRAMWISLFIK